MVIVWRFMGVTNNPNTNFILKHQKEYFHCFCKEQQYKEEKKKSCNNSRNESYTPLAKAVVSCFYFVFLCP